MTSITKKFLVRSFSLAVPSQIDAGEELNATEVSSAAC